MKPGRLQIRDYLALLVYSMTCQKIFFNQGEYIIGFEVLKDYSGCTKETRLEVSY